MPRVILSHWSDKYTGQLDQAHALFEQRFGFACTDRKQVDAAIARLFRRGKSPDMPVQIPAKLVLAIMLRKGFRRGFGRGQLPRDKQARIVDAVLETQQLLPQYLRRYAYERAKEEAAKETVRRRRERCPGDDVTVDDILRRETWTSRRRSRAK
jgi:hypothetical protein